MTPNFNVYVLANRPGPFYELAVPQNTQFIPLNLSDDEQTVHDALNLGYVANDFYLTAYFSAVLSMPDIQRFFRNPTTFDLSRMLPIGTQIIGGALYAQIASILTEASVFPTLLPPSASNLQLSPYPAGTVAIGGKFLNAKNIVSGYTGEDGGGLPIGFTYTVNYVTDNTCQIACLEKQTLSFASCIVSGTSPNQVLNITWPTGWPFTGLLQLINQNWDENAAFRISVRPHNFPFYQTMQAVQYLPYTQQVLQAFQLDAAFHQAIDSVEKTAYLMLAILVDRKQKLIQSQQVTAGVR